MASSQIEIASSSSPFGCVLRDHNRRDQRKESNARVNLQKNLKDLVRDRIQTCISTTDSDTNGDSSVINNDNKSQQKKSRIQERWAQAREMVCNRPQIDNGVKSQKKATLTREMVCSMLQIDNDDFSISDEKIIKNDEYQKKPVPRETKQNSVIDKKVETKQSSINIKKVVNETLQIDNGKNQKKSKILERWARAREIVCNQSPSEINVDSSVKIEQSKESFVQKEQSKNNDKNQKSSKIQERWARARESLCRNNNNDKNQKNSKGNNEDSSVQEKTKNQEKNLKKLRTHERWARAREIVIALDRQGRDSNHQGVSSPLLGGGVSSLLQKWKGYEAEAKSLNSTTSTNTSPRCTIKGNAGGTFTDNSSSCVELPTKTSPSSEYSEPNSADERDGNTRITNIDAFPDWEPDKISLSGPPSTISRDSDATTEEKEKVRVVDLIRKLTSVTKSPQQGSTDDIREGDQMLSSNESLPRVGVELLCCPRVRGRQAFSNLLMQIERDRHRELEGLSERKAVSKFSHRGRIQALLKVRLMHQLAKNKDRAIPNSPVSSELNRGTHGSHIMHLRERFCTGVEQGNKEAVGNVPSTKNTSTSNQTKEETHRHDEFDKKDSCQNAVDNTKDVENNTSTPNKPKDEEHHHDVNDPKDSNKDPVHNVPYIESKVETKPCEGVDKNVEQKTSKAENQGIRGEESPSYDVSNIKEMLCAETIWEDIESCQDWLSDISQLRSEWEQMCDDQELVETNIDWISEVARPRSDWENLRQARYREMLDPCSENGDIRQLLERKSVSSFLSSNMRDAIDRLMMSRTQKQTPRIRTPVAKRKDEPEEEKIEELKYGNHSGVDEDDDDGSPIERQINDFNEYTDRTYPLQPHSQSLLSPWSDIQDIAVSDYSNNSQSSFRDNQHFSSFINSPSIEMEFIYELRAHMEQLHQEMFEIRKSLKSCLNMQVKLQRSIKRSVRNEGKESTRRATKKGRCCICNEKRVDSLLYRCGHMCTCFKCAHELQMSTGRCPKCQAPILDIVRTYAENR